jgi:hypothetical protein
MNSENLKVGDYVQHQEDVNSQLGIGIIKEIRPPSDWSGNISCIVEFETVTDEYWIHDLRKATDLEISRYTFRKELSLADETDEILLPQEVIDALDEYAEDHGIDDETEEGKREWFILASGAKIASDLLSETQSLRDEIAMKAMPYFQERYGMLRDSFEPIAESSYKMADAMMAHRKKVANRDAK